jgi:AbrB family looped-hinge helix DNA binding protein
MAVVTVSPKYQIVIPKEVREKFKIKPGEKLIILNSEKGLVVLPDRSIVEMEGFIKGPMDTSDLRDETDRI